jgi:hypothetical protein
MLPPYPLGLQMHGISAKLAQLLAENAHAEPIDQLDRMEFCVDVTGKGILEEEFRQKAKSLEASIALVWGPNTHWSNGHWAILRQPQDSLCSLLDLARLGVPWPCCTHPLSCCCTHPLSCLCTHPLSR